MASITRRDLPIPASPRTRMRRGRPEAARSRAPTIAMPLLVPASSRSAATRLPWRVRGHSAASPHRLRVLRGDTRGLASFNSRFPERRPVKRRVGSSRGCAIRQAPHRLQSVYLNTRIGVMADSRHLVDEARAASRARFARLVARPESEIDLALGALIVAGHGRDWVDEEAAFARLDWLTE